MKELKNLLELIIKELVENEEAVSISETTEDKSVIYKVRVAKEDMGRVIGKQGKNAKSIRDVIKAVALKKHKKVRIEFVD